VGLLGVAAAPAAFVGVGSVLLRLQAGRLRKDFTDAANALDAPGTRTISHPPRFTAAEAPAAAKQPSAALAVLGDSWIAGSAPDDPARLMSRGLASLLGIPVRLTALAEPSARAEALITQVDRALADPHLSARGGPRIAVISM